MGERGERPSKASVSHMIEELSKIFSNGFATYLAICLPFVFSIIIVGIMALVIIGGAFVLASGPFIPAIMPYLTEPGQILPEIIQQLSEPLATTESSFC